MKATTLLWLGLAVVIGHEWGVSDVAKECRKFQEFTNGKFANGEYELYTCAAQFEIEDREGKPRVQFPNKEQMHVPSADEIKEGLRELVPQREQRGT